MTDIPLYRAKRLDNDEYVEGLLFTELNRDNLLLHFICDPFTLCVHTNSDEIDPSTLSIHFPDMLDKNNKPIFASLSEDGEGGSLFKHSKGEQFVATYRAGKIWATYIAEETGNESYIGWQLTHKAEAVVTGIYKETLMANKEDEYEITEEDAQRMVRGYQDIPKRITRQDYYEEYTREQDITARFMHKLFDYVEHLEANQKEEMDE